MFTQILVPLDTSRVAAQALPYATAIMEACRANLTLISVIEPQFKDFGTGDILGVPSIVRHEADDHAMVNATAYLESIAVPLRASGNTVTVAIHHGNPAEEIIVEAESGEPSLIVMSTHGRTGLARLRLGSVALQVMRHAAAPTLIIPAQAHLTDTGPELIQQITVTLDGSPFSETAILPAKRLAETLVVPLTLVRVAAPVVYPTGYDAGTIPPIAEQERLNVEEAEEYLTRVAARLAPLVVQTQALTSPRSAPDEAIIAYLAKQPPGIVVIASHGRGGVARWALGSTAESVIVRAPCPVLVVRATTAPNGATMPAVRIGDRAGQ